MIKGVEDLLGVWLLESFEIRRPDGTVEIPWGKSPKGILVYTPGGRITVQIMATERIPFKTDDIWEGTSGELGHAFKSYNGHFGTFDIDVDGQFVVHHAEGALLPNWSGTEQVRYLRLVEDGRVELQAPPLQMTHNAGTAVLVWRQVEKFARVPGGK